MRDIEQGKGRKEKEREVRGEKKIRNHARENHSSFGRRSNELSHK